MENNLKEINEFINQWKQKAVVYYNLAITSYRAEYERIQNSYDFYNKEQYEQMKQERRELNEKYNQIVKDLAFGYSPEHRQERLNKIIEREAESKKVILIKRVNKEVGKIVKALDLKVGVNGELNGKIQGENGICKIETIYAGGYNIQCLHYRVLVKKVS